MLHEEGKTPDEKGIRYGVLDQKARKRVTRGGCRERGGDPQMLSGESGSLSNVVRTLRMERPVSRSCQNEE